ncbi:MAG: HEAT repeat domain-containing protein [Myxococcales bacterium]|nr:HEAT repeat domain-containing protein [Myxococcales bacterium]
MREPALPVPPRSFDEPAARPARRRPVAVVPVHVFVDEVQVDLAAGRVRGVVHHTVRARVDGVDRLPFDAADLRVTQARLGDDALAVTVHAQGVVVALPEPLEAGEAVTVSLRFEAQPTAGLYFVGGERPQAWTQGAMEDHHHWFPCFDAPEHLVTTEVRATVPEGWAALSNGALLERRAVEGGVRWHWRHDTPHALYLLTLVVDRLVEVSDRHGDVTLHHWVPAGREADARAMFKRMGSMLDFFAEATGRPYPYPRYGHVFLQEFMWGGMENTTLTSLTDRVLVPPEVLDEVQVERLVAHELAHQWFGDLIAPRGWPELWLNESFATYFEILCMGALDGKDDFARRLVAQRDAYLSEAGGRYARPVVTDTYAHPYVLFDRHAYEKGCLLLHTLRHQIGGDAFWRGIRRYVKRAAGTAATSADLQRAFEDAAGEDLTDFFQVLVGTAAHPKVQARWAFDPKVGLEITLTRTDDTAQTLYVDVAWRAADRTRRQRVRLAPGERTLVLPLDAPPLWVAVDPDQACLLEVDEAVEPDAALRARLVPSESPRLLRMRTCRVLAGRGSAANTRALIEALRGDPSHTVRGEAASALGAHRTELAREALAAAVADRDGQPWRVRAAAARGLGLGAEPGWLPRIEALLAAEPRFTVRNALTGAAGHFRDDEAARALIVARLDAIAGPVADRERGAALSALARLERKDTLAVFERFSGAEHAPNVRSVALAGLGRLARAEGVLDKAEARRVREQLERFLGDPVFQVRVSATSQLGQLGDTASRAALERAHGAEALAFVRRLHREALGKLGA